MTLNRIVSGGSESGIHEVGSPRRPRGAPALRCISKPPRASVKVARRLTEFYRAIDWGYVGFLVAVAATAFVLVRFALGRMA